MSPPSPAGCISYPFAEINGFVKMTATQQGNNNNNCTGTLHTVIRDAAMMHVLVLLSILTCLLPCDGFFSLLQRPATGSESAVTSVLPLWKLTTTNHKDILTISRSAVDRCGHFASPLPGTPTVWKKQLAG